MRCFHRATQAGPEAFESSPWVSTCAGSAEAVCEKRDSFLAGNMQKFREHGLRAVALCKDGFATSRADREHDPHAPAVIGIRQT